MKKNKVWRWKPDALDDYSCYFYLNIPPIKGNTPKARFWSVYIIPNPVPINFGGTSIGIVGTIIVQKTAIQIPRRKEGNHATKDDDLSASVDSVNIINRYVIV